NGLAMSSSSPREAASIKPRRSQRRLAVKPTTRDAACNLTARGASIGKAPIGRPLYLTNRYSDGSSVRITRTFIVLHVVHEANQLRDQPIHLLNRSVRLAYADADRVSPQS